MIIISGKWNYGEINTGIYMMKGVRKYICKPWPLQAELGQRFYIGQQQLTVGWDTARKLQFTAIANAYMYIYMNAFTMFTRGRELKLSLLILFSYRDHQDCHNYHFSAERYTFSLDFFIWVYLASWSISVLRYLYYYYYYYFVVVVVVICCYMLLYVAILILLYYI